LRNLLGINRKADMDRAEEEALENVADHFVQTTSKDHCFTSEDICRIHKAWLGKIYSWGGEYRKLNVSKAGFMFAVAEHVPALMGEFEREVLQAYTPCKAGPVDEVVPKLAKVHVEFVLIHPFREGNGRMARMLTTLMALQADLPLLDFSGILDRSKSAYFAAVRAGMKRNYEPMATVMKSVIKWTLKRLS